MACLGHSHSIIADVLITQSTKIMQSPKAGFNYSPARANALLELSKVLSQNMDKGYSVNSGAEANDAAVKLAIKISGRSKIISTLSSFHVRTFNTSRVSTGNENGDRYLPITNNTFLLNSATLLLSSLRLILQPRQLY
ncbi:MAG: acetylornithine/N-succinyldiaminopimelate aminotransferase [Pseudohongiellaceae bacterium]